MIGSFKDYICLCIFGLCCCRFSPILFVYSGLTQSGHEEIMFGEEDNLMWQVWAMLVSDVWLERFWMKTLFEGKKASEKNC